MKGRAREWLDGGRFFDWEPPQADDTQRIFHAQFGDPEAPLLLLVHGFPTSSIDWYDVVDALSRERRVCVLDFPGYGFSDKPPEGKYSLERDCELIGFYLREVVAAAEGAVVAHDRGDSVALAFAGQCAAGDIPFELTNLVISNGNLFLPLSNLTEFQRLVLDPETAPAVLEQITPELLAAGLGQTTFTPVRQPDDPAIRALADTFGVNDGVAVLHATIQYLLERSENEEGWLEALARATVPTAMVWGLYDTVSPLRVAAHVWNTYLSTKPGANEFWLLPRANHYLQHDQPAEFAEVVLAALRGAVHEAPGPLSDAARAPLLVDISRAMLPTAKEALAGS